MEFFEWWNLIFGLPFVAGLMYLALMMFGLTDGDHDMDADADIDHDIGVEHSVDVGHGAHAHVEHESGFVLRALSVLGVGKVPISLILMSLCFIWGFAGWASNKMFSELIGNPNWFVCISILIAGFCSIAGTGAVAKLLSRIMPSTESYASTNQQLIGKPAEITYDTGVIFGRANVVDDYGNRLEISCRSVDEDIIPQGSRVRLMQYDEDKQVFIVQLDPLAQLGGLEKVR